MRVHITHVVELFSCIQVVPNVREYYVTSYEPIRTSCHGLLTLVTWSSPCSSWTELNGIRRTERYIGTVAGLIMHGFVRCWPVLSPGSWQPFWLLQTQLPDGGPVPALLQGLLLIERETEINVLPLYLCYRPGTSPSQRVCQCQCVHICWSASNCVLVFVQKNQWDVILNSAAPLQAGYKVSSRFWCLNTRLSL